jgi:ATP-binding cassette subfamily B multidrug efflux pump
MIEEDAYRKAFDSRLARRILGYVVPYWKAVAATVLLLLVTTVSQNLFPVILSFAINRALVARAPIALREHNLWLAIWAFLAVRLIGFGAQYGQTYLIAWLGQRILFDLRGEIFSKIQRMHLGFFDRTPVGRLLTRVTSDVQAINQFVTGGLVGLLSDAFLLLGVLSFMLILDWKLSLVIFTLIPPLLWLTILMQRKMRAAYRTMRLRLSRVNAALNENLSGVRTTQLFHQEARQSTRFDRLNKELRDAHVEIIHWIAVFYPLVGFLGEAAVALLVWYGGGQVVQHTLSIGLLVAFTQYTSSMFRPLQDLADKFNLFQGAMASAERVFTLLDTPEEVQDREGALPVTHFRGDITFENVWLAYTPRGVEPREEEWVLRGISFHIQPGEKVALVGATGAGKTSVISLIARFYDPQKGRVLIDGRDVRDYRQRELRRAIGIVLQDPFLFSGTIEYNLSLGDPSLDLERIREVAEFVGAAEFIEKLPLGYQTPLHERGGGLSTGQKQLLALTRAILHNPDILLILDEATSNIDSETEVQIQEALWRVTEGRTSVIIAHRLSTIRGVDRILVFRKGQLVEEGTHEALLAQGGYYSKLYALQYAE